MANDTSSFDPARHPVLVTVSGGAVLAGVTALMESGLLPLYSSVVFLPLFAGVPPLLLPLLPAVGFWLWSYQLFNSEAGVPTRSFIGLTALIVIVIAWFWVGWHWGLVYQGFAYLIAFAAANVVAVVGILALGWWAESTQSFLAALLFHLAVPLWLITIGLPYLGESP